MVEEIKELRVKIDGLSQLVRSLQPVESYIVDVAFIPHGWDLEKFITVHKEIGYGILDDYKGKGKIEDAIKPLPQINGEVQKSFDSLLLAKAWLGKVLQELGTDNPYGSGYKTVEDIIPTQDVNLAIGDNPVDKYHEKNYIEKVDWLRSEIEKVVIKLDPINKEIDKWQVNNNNVWSIVQAENILSFVYKYLSEARFWLGFELGRIREKANKEKNE